ncbi:MAG: BON domain-containing protein [Candidatus Omnitrophica bacterium]|nr:BON domain-containing protein [Candidatus Omnitrophota bacterium]
MKVNYLKTLVAVTAAVLFTSLSARASEMDERIEASFKQSYVFKTYLKDDNIRTLSKDGVVTLTGTVNDEAHKALAKDTVASLPGVKSVDDQLVFKGEGPAENSDGWIGMKVKAVLLFHPHVNAFKTEVDVKEGVVTLKGEALSQAQKDLAGEYAKDVKGVKEVKNEMSIAPMPKESKEALGDKIDDASITAQVKMAFLMHHSTSAFKTGVETKDGIVTLSGEAVNAAGKEMAAKVAEDVKGVVTVINNMTIAK